MARWIWTGMVTGIGTLVSATVIGSVPANAPQPTRVFGRKNASLCAADEAVLATCAIGQRRVSICARGTTVVYRYGRPGRIELTASDLHWASTGYSGGGELQVTARNNGHSYTLFDRIVRTGFETDGPNDPNADSGLVVRRGGRILSARTCSPVEPIAAEVRDLLPEGDFVEH
ncbi:MAG: hypothetical protein PGN21_14670 [Sphingomonas paucimobilis]